MTERYIGVKIVDAWERACTGDIGESKTGDPGYAVKYEDGFISWSPKEVFEKAYRPTSGMPFGLAIEAMREGLSVRLPHWSGDVAITIQVPDENSKMTAPYFYVTSRYGKVPWIPTMIEMFSDDWMVYD